MQTANHDEGQRENAKNTRAPAQPWMPETLEWVMQGPFTWGNLINQWWDTRPD